MEKSEEDKFLEDKLNEAAGFLVQVDRVVLAQSLTAILSFYGLTVTWLHKPRSAAECKEQVARMQDSLNVIMQNLPLEVTELVISAVLGRDITDDEDYKP